MTFESVAIALVLAISNLCTMVLTAWLLYRRDTQQSPIPRVSEIFPSDGKFEEVDVDEEDQTHQPTVGYKA